MEEHWIMYDLGELYEIQATHLWNYNVFGETDKGVKDVYFDYSQDGQTWLEFGAYTFSEATGSDNYAGEIGPDFNFTVAQYVLMSVSTNWGNAECQGFAEIKLNVTPGATYVSQPSTPQLLFEAYPNPASENFTVQLERGQHVIVELISNTGQLVYSQETSKHRFTVPVDHLADGIYFIRITDDNQISATSRIAVCR
jgi:hypothetical protein